MSDLPFSAGLRCGELLFVGAQMDLDWQLRVRHANDPGAQLRAAMRRVARVLASLDAEPADLVRLTVFHVAGCGMDEQQLAVELAACLDTGGAPGPTLTMVPLPRLAFAGLDIQIEAIAMRGDDGSRLARATAWSPEPVALPAPFVQALRCGDLLFTSGMDTRRADGEVESAGSLVDQSRLLLPRIDRLLGVLGASLRDVVKTNVYNVEPGRVEDWAAGASTRAAHYPEPGPAATGISLPCLSDDGLMLRNDVLAVVANGASGGRDSVSPVGHWNWPVRLPYRHGVRSRGRIWLGGQVSLDTQGRVIDADDIERQTERAMQGIERLLEGFEVPSGRIAKINVFASAADGHPDLHACLARVAARLPVPGPVLTWVPLPWLAYQRMVVEIDAWAIE